MTRVDVTQEDIKDGSVRNCRLCPVARALARTLNWDITVGTETFTLHPAQRQFILPNEARQFIERFDMGGQSAVTPFTFHVEIPQEVLA